MVCQNPVGFVDFLEWSVVPLVLVVALDFVGLLCLLVFFGQLLLCSLYLLLLSCSILVDLLGSLSHLPCLFFTRCIVLMLYCRFLWLDSLPGCYLLAVIPIMLPCLLGLQSLCLGRSLLGSSLLTLMYISR